MGKKKIFSLIVIAFLLLSVTKKFSEITIQKMSNPPGTLKVAENLYLDKTDICNVHYREFLYWMKNVYGINSTEYKAVLPDTTKWSSLKDTYASLDKSYLRQPSYNFFPVIGVSNKQALQYSKWRSDRVMEMTLIEHRIIKAKSSPIPKDSVFTIEKYFNGQYYNIKPSPNLLFYPDYRLLDSTINTSNGFRNVCTYKKWE